MPTSVMPGEPHATFETGVAWRPRTSTSCDYNPGMGEFWVYEDVVVYTATSHRGE
jgi:hypothetical protein